MIRIASGEWLHGLLDDGPDDAGVLGEQVVPAHARLAGQAGRDDDDVGAGGVRVVVRADHAGVVPDHRRGLGKVEALALRQPLDDVDEDDVGDARLRDALGGSRADVAGADDGDLVPGHDSKDSFGLRDVSNSRTGGAGHDPGLSKSAPLAGRELALTNPARATRLRAAPGARRPAPGRWSVLDTGAGGPYVVADAYGVALEVLGEHRGENLRLRS